MKTKVFAVITVLVGLLALGLFISCGEKLTETPTSPSQVSTPLLKAPSSGASTPISQEGITPYIIPGENPGGNRTCDEVATAFELPPYDNSSARFDDGTQPTQCGGTVGPITWWTDPTCTYVCWSSSVPIKVAVIVKGGNNANVYVYEECTSGDCGLASPPVGAQQNPAELSNITFCWTECKQEECWQDETAWAAGRRYVTKGNWATYTPYVANSTVKLYAGQFMEAGTVKFEGNGAATVKITICLNDGWRFDPDESENVKIQDYASAPSGNPSPGLFAHKGYATGTCFSITVPKNNFYGVHVDVQKRVPCP